MTSKLKLLVLVIGGAAAMFVAASHTVVAASAPTLEQQEHCAKLAKDRHDDLASPYKSVYRLIDNYSSHVNTKIGKCLVLTNSVEYNTESHVYSQQISLYDPIERREYAYWLQQGYEYPKQYKTKDTWCKLWPPSGETIDDCTSREQFDAYVNSYMNE
jgi:hypothetical protein